MDKEEVGGAAYCERTRGTPLSGCAGMVRAADPARDAAACAAIYAPSVTDGFASFEDAAPVAEEMAVRIDAAVLWLVAERDGAVVGWASATPFMARAAYRWAVSVAVYIADSSRRQGVGGELYGVLLPLLAAHGYATAMAGVSLPNPGSLALHDRFGFASVGVLRGIGYKAGEWRDVAWLQRDLAPRRDPPPEPAAT